MKTVKFVYAVLKCAMHFINKLIKL